MDIVLIERRLNMEVENMTLPELKAVLAKYNLDTSGKRADLVSRLSSHMNRGQPTQKETSKSPKLTPKPNAKPGKTGAAPGPANGSSAKGSSNAGAEESKSREASPAKSTTASQDFKTDVTSLSMQERLALRAKRFNLPLESAEDEALEVKVKRSKRFGIPLVGSAAASSAKASPAASSKTSKLEKRLKKKKFDFPVDDAELERRKKRLERFQRQGN